MFRGLEAVNFPGQASVCNHVQFSNNYARVSEDACFDVRVCPPCKLHQSNIAKPPFEHVLEIKLMEAGNANCKVVIELWCMLCIDQLVELFAPI